MKMGDLFNEEDYAKCCARIDKLENSSTPQWGKMNAAQMFAHCSEVQAVLNGKELKNIPFAFKFFKGLIKKSVLSKKEYPKNARTSTQYVISSNKDFEEEKAKLLKLLKDFHFESKEKSKQYRHSLFGKMTREERAWAAFKHLDHHLRQFGL